MHSLEQTTCLLQRQLFLIFPSFFLFFFLCFLVVPFFFFVGTKSVCVCFFFSFLPNFKLGHRRRRRKKKKDKREVVMA